MTQVHGNLRLSDDLSLTFDREVTGPWGIQIGKWFVEIVGDNLIVREAGQPLNDPPLLKVPA